MIKKRAIRRWSKNPTNKDEWLKSYKMKLRWLKSEKSYWRNMGILNSLNAILKKKQ